ncbi:MAG: hypothetical protein JWP66_323 [Naasia sp.]|nr:hypothetical protein [Naasia sp.]
MVALGSPSGRWPGERLGRPESGVASVARPAVRIAAILIDFAFAFAFYAMFFFGDSFASLIIFAIEQYVLIAAFGGSIGHLLLGMRVVKLDNTWAGLWRPAVRTVLLALLIPAVIWDADQRGLHDVFAGTVLIRVR